MGRKRSRVQASSAFVVAAALGQAASADFVGDHCTAPCSLSAAQDCCTSPFGDRDIVDAHTHFWTDAGYELLASHMDGGERSFGLDIAVQQSLSFVSNWVAEGALPTNNLVSIVAALERPERFRIFGSLDMSVACDGSTLPRLTGTALRDELAAQVDTLADLGVVGLKFHFVPDPAAEGVLETSACAFDTTGNRHRLENPAFDGVWDRAEARGLPVLIHVLAGSSLPGLLAMANAHPDLTILLTHNGFQYDANFPALVNPPGLVQPDRFFIDPGGAACHLGRLIAEHGRDETRALYEANPGRFVAGSDWLGERPDVLERGATRQLLELRALHETDEEITGGCSASGAPVVVRGLALSEPTLQAVYHDNWQRIGSVLGPQTISCEKRSEILDYVGTLRDRLDDTPAPGGPNALSLQGIDQAESAIEALCPTELPALSPTALAALAATIVGTALLGRRSAR